MGKFLLEPNFIWHIRNFNKIHILKFKITVKFFTENLPFDNQNSNLKKLSFSVQRTNDRSPSISIQNCESNDQIFILVSRSNYCSSTGSWCLLLHQTCYIGIVFSCEKKYIFFNLSINFSLYFTSQRACNIM
jgi:hypothetical protein